MISFTSGGHSSGQRISRSWRLRGASPVTISYRITDSAKRSAFSQTRSPERTSGAAHSKVPSSETCVSSRQRTLARPTSATLHVQSLALLLLLLLLF